MRKNSAKKVRTKFLYLVLSALFFVSLTALVNSGYQETGKDITRAEICKIIVERLDLEIDTSNGPHFPDVPKILNENSWAYDYVETMYNMGFIGKNYDGTFKPNQHVNRAEGAMILVKSLGLEITENKIDQFTDVRCDEDEQDWYCAPVQTLLENNILTRSHNIKYTFRPNDTLKTHVLDEWIDKAQGNFSGSRATRRTSNNSCTDSDGGKNYYKKGKVKFSNGQLS